MMEKKIELTLPAFAFLEDSGHDGNALQGRNVIMHVRSASVVEILERDKCGLKEGVVKKNFTYTNRYGLEEKMVAVLHFCMTLDSVADREMIINEVLIPAVKWYCDWADWEDKNIEEEDGLW